MGGVSSSKVHGNTIQGKGVGDGIPTEEHKVLLATVEITEPVDVIEFGAGVPYCSDLEISFTNVQFSDNTIAMALGLQFQGADAKWKTDYVLSLSGTERIVKRDNWESLLLTDHMPVDNLSGNCWLTGMNRWAGMQGGTFQSFVKGKDKLASFHGGGICPSMEGQRLRSIRLVADPSKANIQITRGFFKLYGRKDK